MRNLHGIAIAGQQAYLWFSITGGNGQRIAGGFSHLFLVDRGAPPPIDPAFDTINAGWGNPNRQRRLWMPWNLKPRNMRDALCGLPRSRARWPNFHNANNWDWNLNLCPDCTREAERLNVTTHFTNHLVQADPWIQTRPTNWMMPDPLTGR